MNGAMMFIVFKEFVKKNAQLLGNGRQKLVYFSLMKYKFNQNIQSGL